MRKLARIQQWYFKCPPICSFSCTLCWGVSRTFCKPHPQGDWLHEHLTMEFSENFYFIVLGRESFLDPAAYGSPVSSALGGWEKCDSLTTTRSLCHPEQGPRQKQQRGVGGGWSQEERRRRNPFPPALPAFWCSAQGWISNVVQGKTFRDVPWGRLPGNAFPALHLLPEFCENALTTLWG